MTQSRVEIIPTNEHAYYELGVIFNTACFVFVSPGYLSTVKGVLFLSGLLGYGLGAMFLPPHEDLEAHHLILASVAYSVVFVLAPTDWLGV